MDKNLNIQGFFLIQAEVAALNNAGKQASSNLDNAVNTKKVYIDNVPFVYVSGQAFRLWWRQTLQKDLRWELSPITQDKKIAFTAANPIDYPDDDMFGYMKAAKEAEVQVVVPEEGQEGIEKAEDEAEVDNGKDKKKQKMKDVTVTRRSPISNSALFMVMPTSIAANWSSMSRQDGNSVPYVKEEYGGILKGQFSIHVPSVGTFSTLSKAGFKNITEQTKVMALQNGCTEINDPYSKDSSGNAAKLVRLPLETRISRIVDTLKALKTISGGAMQANNMTDVTPKFIILATTTSANHPFGNIVGVRAEDEHDEVRARSVFKLSIPAIIEVLKEYKQYFAGPVFIGRRKGFLDEYDSEIAALKGSSEEIPEVIYGPVNKIIDLFTESLKKQMEESV